MKHFFLVILLSTTFLFAHIVQYNIGQKAIYAAIFFDQQHQSSWSKYELFAPNASLPYQKGRTDASGVVSFLPNRAGKWILNVYPGSDHGEHFQKIELQIDDSMVLKEVNKPLYSTYGALISGIAIIFGFFGLSYGWMNRPKKSNPSSK